MKFALNNLPDTNIYVADHPHGGGRGKSKGNVHPVSPWGTPAKGGYKTRYKRNKHTFLVQDRPRNQGKRRPR
jgi:ribosomal protein L2